MNHNIRYAALAATIALLLQSGIALGSVEATLATMQTRLIGTILPLCAILGLVFSAFSFFMGSPNGRTHVFLAVVGCVIGFGAPSIVAFIRGLVH